KNNSIPEDRAIALATGFESELTQRRELIEASLATARSRLETVSDALRQLESSFEELKRQRLELLPLLDAPRNLKVARNALFDPDRERRIKLYQEQVNEAEKSDVSSEVNRLNSDIAKINLAIEKKRNQCFELGVGIGRYESSIRQKDYVLIEKGGLQRD